MKLLVKQKRGLGNQLFQYAAGLYFAKHYGASVELIKEPTEKAWSAGRPRPCLLAKFAVSLNVRELTTWDRIAGRVGCSEKFLRIHGIQLYRQPDCETWIFRPVLPIRPKARTVYIEGFFEAYRFAEIVEKELRRDVVLLESPTGKNIECLKRIGASQMPVSLHIRRGDYAVERGGENLLPMSYYRDAMDTARRRISNPTFFVFSDDISFARQHLPTTQPLVFIEHNGEANAHEDLRLMSSCRHHIIANSTFSWWGAWLNPRADKLVYAPDSWRKHDYPRVAEIIPPAWNRITVP